MDRKKTLLLVLSACTGLLLIILITPELNPHISGFVAGLETFNAAAFITLAAVLGLIIFYVLSPHLQYSQTVKWFSAIRMDDVRDSESCHHYEEDTFDLPVPCRRVSHVANLALHLLPSVIVISTDAGSGTLRANTEDNFGTHSFVIVTCQENGNRKTTVTLCSFFPWPVKNDTGQNRKNVAILNAYIRDHALQPAVQDGTNPYHKNPAIAAGLSLLLPGLGQSYNGRSDEGMAIALGAGVFFMLGFLPGIVVWLFGVYYSWSAARRMNSEQIPYYSASVPGMFITACFAVICLAAAWYVLQHFGIAGLVPMALDPVGTCTRFKCI